MFRRLVTLGVAMAMIGCGAEEVREPATHEIQSALTAGTTGLALGYVETNEQWTSMPAVNGLPNIIAAVGVVASHRGGDTAAVRMRNVVGSSLQVRLEEETSRDAETAHVTEQVVLWLATNNILRNATGSIIGRAGRFTHTQDGRLWRRINFPQPLANPVVFAQVMTFNGGQPCSTRVRNVDSTGFEFRVDEWSYLDGHHAAETIGWIALSKGKHLLTTGGSYELTYKTYAWAGAIATNHAFRRVDALVQTAGYVGAGGVVAQSQSFNGPAPIVERLRSTQVTRDNTTSLDWEVKLDEEENADRLHAVENVGIGAFIQELIVRY